MFIDSNPIYIENFFDARKYRFSRLNHANNKFANVNLLEDEYGISPGQACVFYSKNNEGYKVLGGGWVEK